MSACIFDALPTLDASIKKGDEFADAELYSQATAYYLEALNDLSGRGDAESRQLTILYAIPAGTSLHPQRQTMRPLCPILEQLAANAPDGQIRYDAQYLLALTYKNLKHYFEAKIALQRYLDRNSLELQTYKDEARFQLGLVEFLRGDYDRRR